MKENRLKKIAYELLEKAREESNKYTNCQDEETFKCVCKAYEDAICHLQRLYNFMKKNNKNAQEVETDINKLKRELFSFKLPHVMNLCLPTIEDQNSFKKNLALLESGNFSSNMLKLIERLPEERSLVDNFTCAFAYELLDDPCISSS